MQPGTLHSGLYHHVIGTSPQSDYPDPLVMSMKRAMVGERGEHPEAPWERVLVIHWRCVKMRSVARRHGLHAKGQLHSRIRCNGSLLPHFGWLKA